MTLFVISEVLDLAQVPIALLTVFFDSSSIDIGSWGVELALFTSLQMNALLS